MTDDATADTVIYRSKMHATLKRNYQLMPALKWLWLLLNRTPDKYEHLVRYYGYTPTAPAVNGARLHAERPSTPMRGRRLMRSMLTQCNGPIGQD